MTTAFTRSRCEAIDAATAEGVPDRTAVVCGDRRITYANQGFTRLTGYTEAELLGRSCARLQGPETEPALGRRLRTLDATLTSLQARSPSDADRAALTDARRAVAELLVAIDGDVRLRIGPPAPTAEQLATSHALINQHALDLDETLARLATVSHART